MSYPDKLKVSGTLSVGPGGDRQLVPIVPAVIVQDGEENGRPTWGVTASGWAIKIKWTGEGPSSYWRMEITRPDTVIGIWSSKGYGGAEELIGLYVQASNAIGQATVGIDAPVITGVVADTNSLTVSLTGVDVATHTLLYRLSTATEWTTGGTRTGNGNVTISGLSAGTYYVIAYSTLSGVNSTPGNLVPTSIQAVGVVLKEAIMAVLIDDARLDFGTSLGKLLGKHQQIPYGIYFVSPPVKPDIPFITYQFLGETDRWVDEIILNITIYSNDFDTICKRIKKLLNGKQISSLSDCRFLMCKWDWCGPDLWDDNLKVYYKNSRYIIKIKR